jgi:hypothetical protein
LKIRVSAVQFRPWAPFDTSQLSQSPFSEIPATPVCEAVQAMAESRFAVSGMHKHAAHGRCASKKLLMHTNARSTVLDSETPGPPAPNSGENPKFAFCAGLAKGWRRKRV